MSHHHNSFGIYYIFSICWQVPMKKHFQLAVTRNLPAASTSTDEKKLPMTESKVTFLITEYITYPK